MQALEGKKLINEIERQYDVMSIKWRGISVWPFLRMYLKESITTKRENKMSASNIGLVLKCLFAFNPLRAIIKHSIWVFTSCDVRKQLGDKMINSILGAFATTNIDCLMIEKPLQGIGHYSKDKIEERNIISEAWLLMLFHIIEVFSRVVRFKLDNEDLLHQILHENSLDFNYRRYVRILNAQRIAIRLMLTLTPKPKMVFIECPYTSMGYVWAFHEKKIKVIEMQHGSLNGNHLAYNANHYDKMLNPDVICVYGTKEYIYLTEHKPQYAPEVKVTGMYMLELADSYFSKDIFINDRNKYNAVIIVSGQPSYEDSLACFIDTVASEHKNILFIYKPRHPREDIHFTSDNVRLENGVNIYGFLKWADIHVTITSTTCLEAQYFRTPTIFYNYENLPATYYKELLADEDWVSLVDNPYQFGEMIKAYEGHIFNFKEIFAHEHVKRLLAVVNDYM